MIIESYRFGHIVVDGKAYSSDVIIYPDGVEPNWYRKEGHRLSPEDLEGVASEEANTLIVGSGNYGLMKVPQETLEYLAARGLEVIVEKTDQACETYNRLSDEKRVIAALHLSC